MHMLIAPMRYRGVALTAQERRRYPAIRGNVMVNFEDSQDLGRSANVARYANGGDPLPSLLDATLAGMANTGFVLSGLSTSTAARLRNPGGVAWSRGSATEEAGADGPCWYCITAAEEL